MNATQKKSLQLIREHFKNINPADFLKEYESLEENIGPTIDSFITKDDFSIFVESETIPVKTFKQQQCEIISISYKEKSNIYSANDDIYLEQQLAA
ncbi:MAG: hypothetical protein GQ569_05035 [Methylococcaceae bacterium]|nr:hypothetical protein [Methylococcaceae bacterium]